MNNENIEIINTSKGRTLLVGDIHGSYKALLQCLERSGFNNEEDTLIQLGDVVDGWSQSYECVEELLKIKNLVAIRGNHDQWFNEWLLGGNHGSLWLQGASSTYDSYANNTGFSPILPSDVKKEHRRFFEDQLNYYIDDQHRLFVHGGYNRHFHINETADFMFYWDRDMWSSALCFQSMIKGGASGTVNRWKNQDNFKNIFIGHTTTMNWDIDKPMKAGGGVVYNLDTGAGFKGRLTIMDVETKSFWQSDKVADLYPDEKGRR